MRRRGKKGETWICQRLFDLPENPQGCAKATKMPFAGIGDDKQRADDVVVFPRSLSDKLSAEKK